MVQTPCRELKFDPLVGRLTILHAAWHGQKKKKASSVGDPDVQPCLETTAAYHIFTSHEGCPFMSQIVYWLWLNFSEL